MRWTESDAEMWVLTFKEGVLSRVAHDLKLRVESFSVDVEGDGEVPDAVTVSVDPASLRVVCAMRHGKEAPAVLSASDRRDIEKNLARDVLPARKIGEIRFVSSTVESSSAGWVVGGSLSIGEASRRLEVEVRATADHWEVQARLDQRRWGIEPYRAMLGALKVAAEVVVSARLPRPPT